jgi:hypothetical protein
VPQLKSLGKPFEVVFSSADRDERSFGEYYSHMPWLAVDYDEEQVSTDARGGGRCRRRAVAVAIYGSQSFGLKFAPPNFFPFLPMPVS